MKFNSVLSEKVSGSVGSLAGAMGAGGSHFRRKIAKAPRKSRKQIITQDYLREANKAWALMSIEVKEQWATYGKTLKDINQTGHMVSHTGWNAFSVAFTLMLESGMNTTPLLTSAPANIGYLQDVEAVIIPRGLLWGARINTVGFFGISTYYSVKSKDTINTNTKGNIFYRHWDITWPANFNWPASVRNSRYFFKFRMINQDGGISRPLVIREDLGNP